MAFPSAEFSPVNPCFSGNPGLPNLPLPCWGKPSKSWASCFWIPKWSHQQPNSSAQIITAEKATLRFSRNSVPHHSQHNNCVTGLICPGRSDKSDRYDKSGKHPSVKVVFIRSFTEQYGVVRRIAPETDVTFAVPLLQLQIRNIGIFSTVLRTTPYNSVFLRYK